MQAMQVGITLASVFYMDKFGRRPILLFAGIGQCIFAMCLVLYYLVGSTSWGVFPVVSLYLYVFFFSCGMGAIPWFIMGEIFKPNVKGLASSIATAVNWLLSFAITETVTPLKDGFQSMLGGIDGAIDPGMGGLFLLYGIVCCFGVLFISTFVPETKGLTAREIQHKLAGKSGKVGRGSNRSSFASSFASNIDGGDWDPLAQPPTEHESILNP